MNDNDLVTLDTFQNAHEARLALDFLGSQGIKAVLSDEHVVGMHFFIGNAIGGVKLKVLANDAERAVTLMTQKNKIHHSDDDQTADEFDESDFADDSEPEESVPKVQVVEVPPTDRELLADRTFRSAIVAILLIPLQIWVLFLLVRVLNSKERLQGPHRTRAWIAACINLP